jgi:predicted ester cyclase
VFIHDFAAAATAAVNAHDPDAVAALWAEPADYSSPTGDERGLDALRAREKALFTGFSDLRSTITAIGQTGPNGAMFVRFNGTHDGVYAGFAPTGRTVAFDMVAIITFNDTGKAIAEQLFYDVGNVAAALTRPAAPVSSGLPLERGQRDAF